MRKLKQIEADIFDAQNAIENDVEDGYYWDGYVAKLQAHLDAITRLLEEFKAHEDGPARIAKYLAKDNARPGNAGKVIK